VGGHGPGGAWPPSNTYILYRPTYIFCVIIDPHVPVFHADEHVLVAYWASATAASRLAQGHHAKIFGWTKVLPPHPFPSPSLPSPSVSPVPYRTRPFKYSYRLWGSAVSLWVSTVNSPSGVRRSPSVKRIWFILVLKSDIWRHHAVLLIFHIFAFTKTQPSGPNALWPTQPKFGAGHGTRCSAPPPPMATRACSVDVIVFYEMGVVSTKTAVQLQRRSMASSW